MMSEEKEGKLSLSAKELQAIVAAAVGNAVEKSAEILAKALENSKKPYTSPAQLENEQAMRQSMRDTKERIDSEIRNSQNSCPHFQGSNALSEFSSPLTSIIWHKLDYGDVIGICTNCQRIFKPGDPDYATEMRRKSANRMSQSGQRNFYDTAKVIDAGRKAIGCIPIPPISSAPASTGAAAAA